MSLLCRWLSRTLEPRLSVRALRPCRQFTLVRQRIVTQTVKGVLLAMVGLSFEWLAAGNGLDDHGRRVPGPSPRAFDGHTDLSCQHLRRRVPGI